MLKWLHHSLQLHLSNPQIPMEFAVGRTEAARAVGRHVRHVRHVKILAYFVFLSAS